MNTTRGTGSVTHVTNDGPVRLARIGADWIITEQDTGRDVGWLKTFVAVGFAGYGPDMADREDDGCDTVREVCEVIRQELDAIADSTHDTAQAYADAGEFEDAWNTHKLVEYFESARMNLDYDRRLSAPLYSGDTDKLDKSMLQVIADTFPLSIEVNGSRMLYVWVADVEDMEED